MFLSATAWAAAAPQAASASSPPARISRCFSTVIPREYGCCSEAHSSRRPGPLVLQCKTSPNVRPLPTCYCQYKIGGMKKPTLTHSARLGALCPAVRPCRLQRCFRQRRSGRACGACRAAGGRRACCARRADAGPVATNTGRNRRRRLRQLGPVPYPGGRPQVLRRPGKLCCLFDQIGRQRAPGAARRAIRGGAQGRERAQRHGVELHDGGRIRAPPARPTAAC